jgi:hypothetical protein
VLKAAHRGAFGEAARQSGSTWLIDDTSDAFLAWLAGAPIGRPRTIVVETPDAPEWVTTRIGKKAWKNSLEWRCEAATADTEQFRDFLLRKAEQMYGDR